MTVTALSARKALLAECAVLEDARRAQTDWCERPVRERLAIIARARGLIANRAAELAARVQLPGRPNPADTLTSELLPILDACRFLERRAARLLSARRPRPGRTPLWLAGTHIEIRREPHGVVLVIGPANYPLMLTAIPTLQALAAGNAVIVKPAAGGGPANSLLAEMLASAGLPDGLLTVTDESVDTARSLLDQPVDKVVFTGSRETGRAVLGQLAGRITPAVMELSGCDAAIVLPDADLELAARALVFGLKLNGGATCIAPRRVFVPRTLATALAQRLRTELTDAPACPLSAATGNRIQQLVAEATGQGARVLCGVHSGNAMTPTVLTDVHTGMAITREDVFAPLLSIIPVASVDEAIAQAHACPYALGASVFGPQALARKVAARLNAGVVVINDMIVPTADGRVPFGGRGDSGFGTTRGAEGLLEMTRIKAVMTRRGRTRRHFTPLPDGAAHLVAAYLRAAYGAGWRERLAGVRALWSGAVAARIANRSEHD